MAPKRRPVLVRITDNSLFVDRGYLTLCRVFRGTRPGRYCTVKLEPTADGPRAALAHAVVWEAAYGPVPAGHQLHHLCEQKDCHEVTHLAVITPRAHKLLHLGNECRRKHPLVGENLYINPNGVRVCRTCKNENQRARRAQLRQRSRSAS